MSATKKSVIIPHCTEKPWKVESDSWSVNCDVMLTTMDGLSNAGFTPNVQQGKVCMK